MTEFDAQAGRSVSADVDLSGAQVAADEIDLAGGMAGLTQIVAAGQRLEGSLTEVAKFAA